MVNEELLFDENGNPERHFLPLDVVIVIPGVELSIDHTRLEVPDAEEYWYGFGDERQVTSKTLSTFIQLADAPVAAIARFAQQWGLLGLCNHEQPATHRLEERDGRERSALLTYGGCTPSPVETVDAWRMYSQRFRTFLQVAGHLHRGERIADESIWREIGSPRRSFVIGRSPSSLRYQKERLARGVNLQLAASAIQPVVRWGDAAPVIGFAVFGAMRTSLLAALCMQLAFTVSDCKIAICSSCHQTYRPKRRAHPGNMNYCSNCRDAGVDVRARVQRLRDRRRASR